MGEKPDHAENGQPWSPSAPNGKPIKVQSTINSFFKPKAPKYAMAPGSPPPAQTVSMGDIRGFSPSFRPGAHNQASAAEGNIGRSPERAEDWVSLSPPKVGDLAIGSASNGDGTQDPDERVVALPEDGDITSPSRQLRQEQLAASVPLRKSPAVKPIHPKASIVPVQPSHVASIKRINGLLLCINYPAWFYTQLSPPTPYSAYSRAILWNEAPGNTLPTVIGSLITRRDPVSEFNRSGEKEGVKPDNSALYIAALTLLSPYRSMGLAQAALESVIRQIVATPATQEGGGIKSLYAHVWTENEEGLAWYRKMGFHTEGAPVLGYYARLLPSTAWVLRRRISVVDNLPSQPQPQAPFPRPNPYSLPQPQRQPVPWKEDMLQSKILQRPPPNTARSFMARGPENEWNDLPEHMVVPRSGTSSAARTPGASAPPSGPPSRAPSVPPLGEGLLNPGLLGAQVGEGSGTAAARGKKKKSRAYPAAAVNGDVVNGRSVSGSGSGSGM